MKCQLAEQDLQVVTVKTVTNSTNSPEGFAADFDTPVTGQSSSASFRCAKPL